MSSHGNGDHGPGEGAPGVVIDHPIERNPHMERNAHHYEDNKKKWESAELDKGFLNWLDGHPEFEQLVDQSDTVAKLKWYDFYKHTAETKSLLKDAFEDDIREIQGGRININASKQVYSQLESDIERLARGGIMEGETTPMEKMEQLYKLSSEYANLKKQVKARKEKLEKNLSIAFPSGDSRERFKNAVSSLNDWAREREAQVAAEAALEEAKRELRKIEQSRSGVVNKSKFLVGKVKGMFKKGEAAGPDALVAAKEKVTNAEQAVRGAATAVSQRETSLTLEFGFQKNELNLNLNLVRRLHHEDEFVKNGGAEIKTTRKKMMESFGVGRNALNRYLQTIENATGSAMDKTIQAGKEAAAEAQRQNPDAGVTPDGVPDLKPGEALIADEHISKAVSEMERSGVHFDSATKEKRLEVINAAIQGEVARVSERMKGDDYFRFVEEYKRQIDDVLVKSLGGNESAKVAAKVEIAKFLQEYINKNPALGSGRKTKIRELVRYLAPNGTP